MIINEYNIGDVVFYHINILYYIRENNMFVFLAWPAVYNLKITLRTFKLR